MTGKPFPPSESLALTRRSLLTGTTALAAAVLPPVAVRAAAPPALRRLPLEAGAKVMGIGHSFIAGSGWTTRYPGDVAPRIDTMTSSWGGTLGPLRNLDTRFNLDTWYQPGTPPGRKSHLSQFAGALAGVAGEHMPATLDRLDWHLRCRPDVVVLDIGTNDISSGRNPDGSKPIAIEELVARYDAILARLRKAGVWTVCCLPVRRTDWRPGDPRHDLTDRLAAHIASRHGEDGLVVCDDRAALAAAAARGVAILEDGVHLSTAGQWVRYSVLLPLLRAMVKPGDRRGLDWRQGNLSPVAGLTGTDGGKVGVGGAVASGLTLIRTSGQNDRIVASKEKRPDGGEWQVVTIEPAGNDRPSRVCELRIIWPRMDFATIGLKPGDWVEAGFDFELSASPHWLGLVFALEAGDGPKLRQSVRSGMNVRLPEEQDGPPLAEPLRGFVSIPPFKLLGPPALVSPADHFDTDSRPIRLMWNRDARETLVARIGPIVIRKTRSPAPAWNMGA